MKVATQVKSKGVKAMTTVSEPFPSNEGRYEGEASFYGGGDGFDGGFRTFSF
jgi:hypothetical protein